MTLSSISHSGSDGQNLYAILGLNTLKSLDTDSIDALQKVGIQTLADLLHYTPIHKAHLLVATARGEIAHSISLTGIVKSQYIEKLPEELIGESIDRIIDVDPGDADIWREKLDIHTIEELAEFEAFTEAQKFLAREKDVFSEPASSPAVLMPKVIGSIDSRVGYASFVRGKTRRFEELTWCIDPNREYYIKEQIALSLIAGQIVEFRLGYVCKFDQCWTNMGTHLGEPVHSLALAPGESRNIAVIDWKRAVLARRDENTNITEHINSTLVHKRALDEVTRAVATEHQSGGTKIEAATIATGLGGVAAGAAVGAVGGALTGALVGTAVGGPGGGTAVGAGVGVVAGAAVGGVVSFGGVLAANQQFGVIETDTGGVRDVLGRLHQQINDATTQKSSAIRSLWSTVVFNEEQAEQDSARTLNVTNYNHMHALTIQYFEVLQHYDVATEVADMVPLIYVPFKPLAFDIDFITANWELLSPGIDNKKLASCFDHLIKRRRVWLSSIEAPENLRVEEIALVSYDHMLDEIADGIRLIYEGPEGILKRELDRQVTEIGIRFSTIIPVDLRPKVGQIKGFEIDYQPDQVRPWNEKVTAELQLSLIEEEQPAITFDDRENTGHVWIREIKDGGSLGNETYIDRLASGWSTIEFYTVNDVTYLLLIRKEGYIKEEPGDEGYNAIIYKMTHNGEIDNHPVQTIHWTEGYTVARYLAKNLPGGNTGHFIFLVKSDIGKWSVVPIDNDGKLGNSVNSGHWTVGWTTVEFFTQGVFDCLFLLKKEGKCAHGTHRAHVHRLSYNIDIEDPPTDMHSWGEGWTHAREWYGNLFLLKEGEGKSSIYSTSSGGGCTLDGETDENEGDLWTPGWTTAEPFKAGAHYYLFRLKKQGAGHDGHNIHINKLANTGKVGELKHTYTVNEGWSLVRPFSVGNKNYCFFLKGGEGANIDEQSEGMSVQGMPFHEEITMDFTGDDEGIVLKEFDVEDIVISESICPPTDTISRVVRLINEKRYAFTRLILQGIEREQLIDLIEAIVIEDAENLLNSRGVSPTDDRTLQDALQTFRKEASRSLNELYRSPFEKPMSRLDRRRLIEIMHGTGDCSRLYLTDLVEPEPIAITENSLVFKAKSWTNDEVENQSELKPLLETLKEIALHAASISEKLEEHRDSEKKKIPVNVYLPTSGLFAEAILGRSNASEKIDITRFYNWQDSPIPHLAPRIEPMVLQSRAQQVEGMEPTQPANVLNLMNAPSLPDPTGLTAALSAIQNGQMFRDMSGKDALGQVLSNLSQLASETASTAGQLTGDAAKETLQSATKLGSQVMDAAGNLAGSALNDMSGVGGVLNQLDKMKDTAGNRGVSTGGGDQEPLETPEYIPDSIDDAKMRAMSVATAQDGDQSYDAGSGRNGIGEIPQGDSQGSFSNIPTSLGGISRVGANAKDSIKSLLDHASLSQRLGTDDHLPDITPILKEWYELEVLPTLRQAENDDQLIRGAVREFLHWMSATQQLELLGATDLNNEQAQGSSLAISGLKNAIRKSNERLATSGDIEELKNIDELLAIAQLLGAEGDLGIGEGYGDLNAKIKIQDFSVDPPVVDEGETTRVKFKAGIFIGQNQPLVDPPFDVTVHIFYGVGNDIREETSFSGQTDDGGSYEKEIPLTEGSTDFHLYVAVTSILSGLISVVSDKRVEGALRVEYRGGASGDEPLQTNLNITNGESVILHFKVKKGAGFQRGIPVIFRLSGGGGINPNSVTTDSDGRVQVGYTAPDDGQDSVTVACTAVEHSSSYTATATIVYGRH